MMRDDGTRTIRYLPRSRTHLRAICHESRIEVRTEIHWNARSRGAWAIPCPWLSANPYSREAKTKTQRI